MPDARVPGRIETNRWYDIRIELQGPSVKCYLDGQLVQEATRHIAPTLYSVAGRDKQSGDLILWVVNPSSQPVDTRVELDGLRSVSPTARTIILTSDSPEDENSFAEPNKVAPRVRVLETQGSNFEQTFSPYSLTLLRIPTAD